MRADVRLRKVAIGSSVAAMVLSHFPALLACVLVLQPVSATVTLQRTAPPPSDPDHAWWLNPCGESSASSLPYCNTSLGSWARALDLASRLNTTDYLWYWNSTQRSAVKLDAAGVFIPPMGMVEAIHGAVTGEGIHGAVPASARTTDFPIGVGMGSSFDAQLVHEIGQAVGTETRIKRNHYMKAGLYGGEIGLVAVAPQLNLARDLRWGRTQEVFGECPFAAGVLGAQYTAGLRGNHSTEYLVVPAPKH
jgi:beta-glucosidase